MIESGAKSNRAVKQLTFSSPLPYFRSVHLSICCYVWPVHPHVHQYLHPYINMSICPSICPLVCQSIWWSVCPPVQQEWQEKSCIYCQTTIHHIQFFSPTPPLSRSSHVNVESIFVPSAWYANKNLWNVILKCNISRTSEQDHWKQHA